jgi:hypothetical protein
MIRNSNLKQHTVTGRPFTGRVELRLFNEMKKNMEKEKEEKAISSRT